MPADRYHYEDGSPTCYHKGFRVVRFYRQGGRRTIISRCTLGEAQAHCSDPETSSSTATKPANLRRTRRLGDWFDGYEER
jgi:hypothetical protein